MSIEAWGDDGDVMEGYVTDERAAEMVQEATAPYKEILLRLEVSLNDGVLLGNFNEPLDSYGKRLIRAILVEFDRVNAH